MSERFREQHWEDHLTKAQALAYVGYKSGKWVSDKWLYARVRDGRLSKIWIDRKKYYSRIELDALLTPPKVERHEPLYSERDWMTITEVAHSIHLSKSYISRLVREGKIKVVNLSGKKGRGADYRIHRNDYMRWVEQRWLEQQQQQEKVGVGAR